MEHHRREAQALDALDSKIGDSLTIVRMASNEKETGLEERFNKVIQQKDEAHRASIEELSAELKKAQQEVQKARTEKEQQLTRMKKEIEQKDVMYGQELETLRTAFEKATNSTNNQQIQNSTAVKQNEGAVRIDEKIREVYENRKQRILQKTRPNSYDDVRDRLMDIVNKLYDEFRRSTA